MQKHKKKHQHKKTPIQKPKTQKHRNTKTWLTTLAMFLKQPFIKNWERWQCSSSLHQSLNLPTSSRVLNVNINTRGGFFKTVSTQKFLSTRRNKSIRTVPICLPWCTPLNQLQFIFVFHTRQFQESRSRPAKNILVSGSKKSTWKNITKNAC